MVWSLVLSVLSNGMVVVLLFYSVRNRWLLPTPWLADRDEGVVGSAL